MVSGQTQSLRRLLRPPVDAFSSILLIVQLVFIKRWSVNQLLLFWDNGYLTKVAMQSSSHCLKFKEDPPGLVCLQYERYSADGICSPSWWTLWGAIVRGPELKTGMLDLLYTLSATHDGILHRYVLSVLLYVLQQCQSLRTNIVNLVKFCGGAVITKS